MSSLRASTALVGDVAPSPGSVLHAADKDALRQGPYRERYEALSALTSRAMLQAPGYEVID